MNQKEIKKIKDKTLKKEIKKYKDQNIVIDERVEQLETQLFELTIFPEMEKMVGKCFKYLNSGSTTHKKWWLYSRIIGINSKTKKFIVCMFQSTSYQNVEIHTNTSRHCLNPLEDYLFQIPITVKQFNINITRIVKILEKIKDGIIPKEQITNESP